MTSRDFCYWLQGLFEVGSPDGESMSLSQRQVAIVRKHLSMVFAHEIDPSAGTPEHQKKLDELHEAFEKHKTQPHGGDPFGPKIRC